MRYILLSNTLKEREKIDCRYYLLKMRFQLHLLDLRFLAGWKQIPCFVGDGVLFI